MNSARVLLHLGLPKTATSSLQRNVLSVLDDDGRINFLGKLLEQDYKTGEVIISNYRGKCIRDVAEGKVGISEGRVLLEEILDNEKLNVFSDEGIMVAYPGRDNLPLSDKFDNLKALFAGYDVQVVVTIREPVDYLYSLYVQLYPDFCSKVAKVNTVEKYVDLLLAGNDRILFESFFYSHWLPEIESLFSVSVLEYENLKDPSSFVYSQWAGLLGMKRSEFVNLFNKEAVNVKKKKGKEVEVVKDFRGVESFFYNLLSNFGPLFVFARWLYKGLGMRRLLHYRFGVRENHKYPSGDKYKRIKKALEFGSYRYE